MQPWTEKLQRKTGRRYKARGGKSELIKEFWVLFWLLQVGHTVRWFLVSEKEKRHFTESEKCEILLHWCFV